MSQYHPRRDAGRPVPICRPSEPTQETSWTDPAAVACFVPDGRVPSMLNGICMTAWTPPAFEGIWEGLAVVQPLHEPAFAPPAGLEPAAGVVAIEPDGRVWLVQPTNAFGGAAHAVPKGRVDVGSTLIATALREGWEELGVLVKLTGHLVDLPRSATFTRYYVGHRVAGSPAQMGWESQGGVLCPRARLADLLDGPHDAALVRAIRAYLAR